MWNWLVKFLVETPLPSSSCSCCEARNKKLRQMQQALERGELPEEETIVPAGEWHTECTIRISGESGSRGQKTEEKDTD